jgi:Ribosomal protein L7/L12 C-terminal domain
VEALMLGAPADNSAPVQTSDLDPFLESRIKQLLAERKKIEAIKAYREVYQCGLKEAKDAVDLLQAGMRGNGYPNLPSAPAISDDPFAEDSRRNRSFWIFIFVFLLVAVVGLAFFFLTGNGF